MRRLALSLTAAAALAATGCDRADSVSAPYNIVRLSIRDYRYDHQKVRARAGAVTFAVTNAGRDVTNFRIRDGEQDLGSINTLAPGEYGTTTVRLQPGTYVMYSSTGRHEALGEHGELTVTPSD
jgi:uncharacterized cupredoxin-like copper-binding protein